MSLYDKFRKQMFQAKKDGNALHADVLGMAMAALKNAEIDKGELKKEDELSIVRKEARKIEDSIRQFKENGRDDLAKKEQAQLEVLAEYLPKLMSEDEVEKVVKAKIKDMGASGMQEMGKVMASVMQELQGKADGNLVKELVQKSLSK